MESGQLYPQNLFVIYEVIIVPDPASPTLYYVFYSYNGLRYAKVDMSNGGKVVSKNNRFLMM